MDPIIVPIVVTLVLLVVGSVISLLIRNHTLWHDKESWKKAYTAECDERRKEQECKNAWVDHCTDIGKELKQLARRLVTGPPPPKDEAEEQWEKYREELRREMSMCGMTAKPLDPKE